MRVFVFRVPYPKGTNGNEVLMSIRISVRNTEHTTSCVELHGDAGLMFE